MLNPTLDADYLATQYADDDRLRINDILEPDIAQRVHAACRDDVPYEYLCYVDGENLAIPMAELAKQAPDTQNELQETIVAAASDGVGFFYSGYQMGRTRDEADKSKLTFLHEMFDFLNSDEMISFIATITGQADL